MTYKITHNFRVKDGLPPDAPEKIIYGADLQDEFDAIARETEDIDTRIDNIVIGGGGGDGGGSGAGMVISATEPQFPVDGMQWLESTTAIVWIWDEDKWLEFPHGQTEGATPGGDYDDTALWAAVTSNSTEISGNTADIATNTSAIAANTANISALVPYDDTQVKSDIATNTAAIDGKLDADKIWTGTEAEYNNLSPDADTLYFITDTVRAGTAEVIVPPMNDNDVSNP